ncbi:MAG: pyridoxal-phosphate dependent enzyme [bacterium]
MIDLTEIQKAAKRLKGKIHHSPLLSSRILGQRVGVQLFLKCECFQKTGSFKPRGALNKVLSLTTQELEKGLITVSAGNHAQAVAWAAQQVKAPCAVVMPTDAPRSKIDAVEGYGAEVITHPDRPTLFDKLNDEKEKRGSTFVHPFDDPVVLAGAGTAGLEIIEDFPDVDVVIVPVGGGGLLGGVTSAVKGLKPKVKVVAVELEAGPGLGPALQAGKPIHVDRPETLADGMTPPFVGALPLEIARDAVDEIITVTENEMIETMKLLLTRCKIYAEASGAAATAALLNGKVKVSAGSRVVTLVSGGNVDLDAVCAAFD